MNVSADGVTYVIPEDVVQRILEVAEQDIPFLLYLGSVDKYFSNFCQNETLWKKIALAKYPFPMDLHSSISSWKSYSKWHFVCQFPEAFVCLHNSENHRLCGLPMWICLRDDTIYDVTKWPSYHPGGQTIIHRAAGSPQAGQDFYDHHHSWTALSTLNMLSDPKPSRVSFAEAPKPIPIPTLGKPPGQEYRDMYEQDCHDPNNPEDDYYAYRKITEVIKKVGRQYPRSAF